MDPISLIRVPGDLMDLAVYAAAQAAPGQFKDDAQAELVVRSVILSVVDHLGYDDTQRAMADRLASLLPDDPYERRNAIADLVGEVIHQLGVTR